MPYPHLSTECAEHHGLVRDFGGPRPSIVVLCGSTRFGDAFRDENLRLTLAGTIVLSIGCDMKSDNELWSDPAASHVEALPCRNSFEPRKPWTKRSRRVHQNGKATVRH